MHFGLKNAGPTHQRMMTKMFEPQLDKNIEVYINHMVVKSKIEFEHVSDLGNIFDILRKHSHIAVVIIELTVNFFLKSNLVKLPYHYFTIYCILI